MELRTLTPSEAEALQDGLALAARFLAQEPPFSEDQVQALYDAALTTNAFDQEATQIAVGLAFGELIVSEWPADWVRIVDEYGEETGLCHRDATVVCHPISMVEKRLSKRERIDVSQLCKDTIAVLSDMVASGKY